MSINQERARACKCCGKHVPLPTTFKEYNGTILCPTTFYNVLEYKRVWKMTGSKPSGSVRKHFSEYVQEIVEQNIHQETSDQKEE